MRKKGKRIALARAFATALLMVAGAAAARGEVPLVEAARNQDQRQVRTLLNQRADVNALSGDGSTALLWAAHWNDLETAGLLIRAGADANAANDFRMTPLSQACTNGSAKFVDLLLKAGANPNTPVATGVSPLMTCARSGNADAVEMLLVRGADVNAQEPAQNQTALMWAAAEAASGGAVQALRGGRANSATASEGGTPLLVATMRGQVPLALFLLEQGADPNIADAGLTPLHWAATTWEGGTANPVYGFEDPMAGIPDRQAKMKLVRALLAHGANPNARMTRSQPAFAAGYTDAVGATPFLLASAVDDVEMMRLLLDGGADPQLMTNTNTTAVMAAAALNRLVGESPVTEPQALEAVRFLLDLGVPAGGVTTFNENALFGPAYRGWNTLLELLVVKGADVNVVSKAGVTPWLAASGFGDRLGGVLYNKEGADILAKHGADPKLGRPCQAQNKCR